MKAKRCIAVCLWLRVCVGYSICCFGVRVGGSDCCVELRLVPIKTTTLDSSRIQSERYCSSVPCILPAIQFSLSVFLSRSSVCLRLDQSFMISVGAKCHIAAANSKRPKQKRKDCENRNGANMGM